MTKITRRNVLLTGVAVAALATVPIPAYALHSKDIAYTPGKAVTVSETFWVDSHQDVTVTLSLSPDGAIRLQGRFSNANVDSITKQIEVPAADRRDGHQPDRQDRGACKAERGVAWRYRFEAIV